MKIKIEHMDDSDLEITDGLMALGMDRITANTIAYLNHKKSGLATDIEKATGLNQPEVSMATKRLLENGWISVTKQKKSAGKGRPSKVYTMKVGFGAIVKVLEDDITKKNSVVQVSIAKLRKLVN